MIDINKISNDLPHALFKKHYENARKKQQDTIEAMAISSYDNLKKEVDSRFVNLKYVIDNQWIFFTNYESNKASHFKNNNKISALIYWNKINTQIRIKGKISKCTDEFSDDHFRKRSIEKNALAVCSNQSKIIESYEKVNEKYLKALENMKFNDNRPDYWGGYYFEPFYFEFWLGNDKRINKRESFKYKNKTWIKEFLEP